MLHSGTVIAGYCGYDYDNDDGNYQCVNFIVCYRPLRDTAALTLNECVERRCLAMERNVIYE